MGTVIINSGTQMHIEEIEGNSVTLQQLYEDVVCENYTDTHREKCIKGWGQIGRHGWAILPVLHELTKGKNERLAKAAKEAIRKIDPGAPNITGRSDVSPAYTPAKSLANENRVNEITGKSGITGRREKERFPVQNGHMTVWKTPEVKKVIVTEIPVKHSLAEGTRINSSCCFCEKQSMFTDKMRSISHTMTGKLYCNFCLRNEFYRVRHSRHTLVMSFRGVIAYYYYSFHMAKSCSMFMSEIESYITQHVRFGTQNPLFRYDPESYLWFVDFSKVGTKNRQVPLNGVLESVVDILASFNLYENVRDCSPAQFFGKYKEAITDFHHHHRRPPNQRILTPTLYGCGIPQETVANRAIHANLLRNFTPGHLIENYKVRQRGGIGGI